MRAIGVVLGILMLAGGCSTTEPAVTTRDSSTSTTSSTAPAATLPETTTTTASPTTTTIQTRSNEIAGELPDGTPYKVMFDIAVDRRVQDISAAIMIDDDEGPQALGIAVFSMGQTGDEGLDQLGRYTVHSGPGSVEISIYDTVAGQYPDLEHFLDGSITPGRNSSLPTLALSPPLRWASDEEVPLQMQVVYDGFVVRRGCGELAVACSQTGAVQVIPDDAVVSDGAGLPAEPVWVESTASRPAGVTYLDPGPLSIRGNHDVVWTGTEMIVWGGADGDRLPHLIDGAAFEPDTGQWRMLSPIPLTNQETTRAVWAGSQMIVVSGVDTFGYDPRSDTWSVIGEGLFPPTSTGLLVWTGDHVGAWTSDGVHIFDPSTGIWTKLPDPGFGKGARWEGALRAMGGQLLAVGNGAVYCSGRRIAVWTGAEWVSFPDVSLAAADYADCSWPNQTAVVGDQVVIWEDDIHPTKAYTPTDGAWSEIATIPLPGTEGASGPVPFKAGFLVPQWGEGAIFTAGTWEHVVLPGHGTEGEMIWTGEEILSWGSACCYGDGRAGFISMDAWRWRPPSD